MSVTEGKVPDELSQMTEFSNSVINQLSKVFDREPLLLINDLICEWQDKEKSPVSGMGDQDLIVALATGWGNIIVKEFDWQWATLTFHEYGDWSGLCVVSEDRSLMIMPFSYVSACVAGDDEVKIGASITALNSDLIPKQPPQSYTNVMEGLQHILPR